MKHDRRRLTKAMLTKSNIELWRNFGWPYGATKDLSELYKAKDILLKKERVIRMASRYKDASLPPSVLIWCHSLDRKGRVKGYSLFRANILAPARVKDNYYGWRRYPGFFICQKNIDVFLTGIKMLLANPPNNNEPLVTFRCDNGSIVFRHRVLKSGKCCFVIQMEREDSQGMLRPTSRAISVAPNQRGFLEKACADLTRSRDALVSSGIDSQLEVVLSDNNIEVFAI